MTIYTNPKRKNGLPLTNHTVALILLITMLAVIVSAVVILNLNGRQNDAWDATYREDANAVSMAMSLYFRDHGYWPVSDDGAFMPLVDNSSVFTRGLPVTVFKEALEGSYLSELPPHIMVGVDSTGSLVVAVILKSGEPFIING